MYRLYCPENYNLTAIADALAAEEVEVTRLASPADAKAGAAPTVLLADAAFRADAASLAAFAASGGAVIGVGALDEEDAPDEREVALDGWVAWPHPRRATLLAVRAGLRRSARRLADPRGAEGEADTLVGLRELVEVSALLATERDFEKFFQEALTRARRIAHADGGSLYLVEGAAPNEKRLRFKLAQNDSRPDIPFKEFTLPLTHDSIAGHVALSLETLNVDDVYEVGPGAGFIFHRDFDVNHGYRTKSMLTIPMLTHAGEIVGVLQLVNRKRRYETVLDSAETTLREVVPFDSATADLIRALGAQVAVCLDNNRLYEEIQTLFEGFVTASVHAIEQRDPTTSGHSGRVAKLTVAIAEAVDRSSLPRFNAVSFTVEELRELRYAGLLHDFGKVGVREEVLVKPTKLQPWQLALVERRHAFLRRTAERDHFRRRAMYLEARGREGYNEWLMQDEQELMRELSGLDAFLGLVRQSNLPTVLPEGDFQALNHYATRFFEDADGSPRPFLEQEEVRFLSIRKGSLDDRERFEIESHVTKTWQFLSMIPWSRNLKNIPAIAYGHHEKLNATGYPRHLGAPEIPVQTRMMTISDIYDALTASDRPYKRAVPVVKALDILSDEAKAGMLDPDLLEMFIGGKLYEITTRPD